MFLILFYFVLYFIKTGGRVESNKEIVKDKRITYTVGRGATHSHLSFNFTIVLYHFYV